MGSGRPTAVGGHRGRRGNGRPKARRGRIGLTRARCSFTGSRISATKKSVRCSTMPFASSRMSATRPHLLGLSVSPASSASGAAIRPGRWLISRRQLRTRAPPVITLRKNSFSGSSCFQSRPGRRRPPMALSAANNCARVATADAKRRSFAASPASRGSKGTSTRPENQLRSGSPSPGTRSQNDPRRHPI